MELLTDRPGPCMEAAQKTYSRIIFAQSGQTLTVFFPTRVGVDLILESSSVLRPCRVERWNFTLSTFLLGFRFVQQNICIDIKG